MKKNKERWEVNIEAKTLNPILGALPDSPALRKKIAASSIKSPEECDFRFGRNRKTGKAVIYSDVVGQWLRRNLYTNGILRSAVDSIRASNIYVAPKEIFRFDCPIIAKDGHGPGVASYELIPKGTELRIHFSVPVRKLANPELFIWAIARFAPRPNIYGLSPARSRRFGKIEVISYSVSCPGRESVTFGCDEDTEALVAQSA